MTTNVQFELQAPGTDAELAWIADKYEEIGALHIVGYRIVLNTLQETKRNITKWLADERYLIIMAREPLTRSPIGMVISHLRDSPLDSVLECYIDALYVDPGYRRKGVGASLLEDAARWGKERGAGRVKTFVSINNKEMIQLCTKLGYEETFVEFERRDKADRA